MIYQIEILHWAIFNCNAWIDCRPKWTSKREWKTGIFRSQPCQICRWTTSWRTSSEGMSPKSSSHKSDPLHLSKNENLLHTGKLSNLQINPSFYTIENQCCFANFQFRSDGWHFRHGPHCDVWRPDVRRFRGRQSRLGGIHSHFTQIWRPPVWSLGNPLIELLNVNFQ